MLKELDQRVETMGLHKNVFEVVVPTEEEVEVKMEKGKLLRKKCMQDTFW